MRNHLTAIVIAAALSVGAANATPAFGPSSHRLGGGTSAKVADDAKPMTLLEAVLSFVGFDLAVSVEPVVGETYSDRTGKTKECEQAKKAEVAKAEEKNESEGGESKGYSRPGEPVYLAF